MRFFFGTSKIASHCFCISDILGVWCMLSFFVCLFCRVPTGDTNALFYYFVLCFLPPFSSSAFASAIESKIPPEIFPETAKYTLRALVLQGSDIPIFMFPNAQVNFWGQYVLPQHQSVQAIKSAQDFCCFFYSLDLLLSGVECF